MKKKMYQLRSAVMTITNSLTKQGFSFGQAQRQAWKVVRAIEAMKSDEIVLRFYKDGDDIPQQRFAVAVTTANYKSKGTGRKRNPLQVSYFETTSGKVKSFNAGRFDSFRAVA
jgi:hypothetical protein